MSTKNSLIILGVVVLVLLGAALWSRDKSGSSLRESPSNKTADELSSDVAATLQSPVSARALRVFPYTTDLHRKRASAKAAYISLNSPRRECGPITILRIRMSSA